MMEFIHLISIFLFLDVCREKNSIEDTLKMKISELHRSFEEENELIKRKSRDDVEGFQQEMHKLQIKHEKQIMELNHELDRLRTNGKSNNSKSFR